MKSLIKILECERALQQLQPTEISASPQSTTVAQSYNPFSGKLQTKRSMQFPFLILTSVLSGLMNNYIVALFYCFIIRINSNRRTKALLYLIDHEVCKEYVTIEEAKFLQHQINNNVTIKFHSHTFLVCEFPSTTLYAFGVTSQDHKKRQHNFLV